MMFRRNEGLTLVELMVTIAIGSMITLAATTVLLLGLRINRTTTNVYTQQNTARILLTSLEKLASEGSIKTIVTEDGSWELRDGENKAIYAYDYEDQTVYAGSNEMLSGVLSSAVVIQATETESSGEEVQASGLITFSLTTEDGTYSSTVYNRALVSVSFGYPGVDEEVKVEEEQQDAYEMTRESREAFLAKLLSQRGSYGAILENGISTGIWYSRWFNEAWPNSTPWCACYVSWALNEVADHLNKVPGYEGNPSNPVYAHVQTFREDLQKCADHIGVEVKFQGREYIWRGVWKNSNYCLVEGEAPYIPLPGDLIFFQLDGDEDSDHIGVVTGVEDGYVYTIEGNVHNSVLTRNFSLDDYRILGYGILDWKEKGTTD